MHQMAGDATVDRLIAVFQERPYAVSNLAGVETKHRSRVFGLNRSVELAVWRLAGSRDLTATQKERALALLDALSVLPSSRVPESLFWGNQLTLRPNIAPHTGPVSDAS